MMLKAIQELDETQASSVLAAAARSLLPDPGIGLSAPLSSAERNVEGRVLAEIREKLKIPLQDQSQESKARILVFLSRELSAKLLTKERSGSARSRLGQKGVLRPDQYEIDYSPSFVREFTSLFGVRRSHVEDAVHRPDYFDHLSPSTLAIDSNNAASLWAKAVADDGKMKSKSTLLVEARREGFRQIVDGAWRIFHADVNLDGTSTALEIFTRFINRFGLLIELPGCEPQKLVLRQHIRHEPDQLPFKVLNPLQHESVTKLSVQRESETELEAILVYAVDLTAYSDSLRTNGLPIPERTGPLIRYTRRE